MSIDIEALRKSLDDITQEEIDIYFPPDTKPKGWLSIDEYLPMFLAEDIMEGGTIYEVKFKDNIHGHSMVSDHSQWYYHAKSEGITHWLNK
jgi:hypothetical protein